MDSILSSVFATDYHCHPNELRRRFTIDAVPEYGGPIKHMVRPVPVTPVRCDLRRLLERNSARNNAADLQVLVGQTRKSWKRGSPTMNEAEFSVGQSEQRPKSKNGRRASSKPGSREIDCLQTLARFFAGQLNLVRRLGTAGSLPPESMHSTSGVGRRWDSRWQPTIGARHFALCPMQRAPSIHLRGIWSRSTPPLVRTPRNVKFGGSGDADIYLSLSICLPVVLHTSRPCHHVSLRSRTLPDRGAPHR